MSRGNCTYDNKRSGDTGTSRLRDLETSRPRDLGGNKKYWEKIVSVRRMCGTTNGERPKDIPQKQRQALATPGIFNISAVPDTSLQVLSPRCVPCLMSSVRRRLVTLSYLFISLAIRVVAL